MNFLSTGDMNETTQLDLTDTQQIKLVMQFLGLIPLVHADNSIAVVGNTCTVILHNVDRAQVERECTRHSGLDHEARITTHDVYDLELR
eukprot:COSAG02_NODE_61757_length_267_cov_1.535714_1_plen_88_part_11